MGYNETPASEFVANVLEDQWQDIRSELGLDLQVEADWLEPNSWRISQRVDSRARLLARWVGALIGQRDEAKEELEQLERLDLFAGEGRVNFLEDPETGEFYTEPAPAWVPADHLLFVLLEFYLYRPIAQRNRGLGDRARELLEILTSRTNGSSRRYLARVATCFLQGMAPEGIIMCRAVLESALKDRYACGQDSRGIGGTGRSGLQSWLQCLYQEGAIPDHLEVVQAADRIRESGNRAVHADPSVKMGDLRDTLKDLAFVLHSLE